MIYLSIIIPAYNEEERLPETLKKVRDYLDQKNITSEVIVVNDGSTDETAAITSNWINSNVKCQMSNEAQNQNFKLINNKENQGKGAVVKQGMLEAKGEWRVFMDADGSTDIHEIEKLFNFVNSPSGMYSEALNACLKAKQIPNSKFQKFENCDIKNSLKIENCKIENSSYEVIIGSRYLDKKSIKIKQPLSRRMVSRVGNILVRLLLGIKSRDTQCGFKLFSAKAAQEIFPLQTITRWGFDVEILAIALKLGYKIKEVPVDWYDAEGSTVKSSAAFKTLKELFEIRKRIKRMKKL